MNAKQVNPGLNPGCKLGFSVSCERSVSALWLVKMMQCTEVLIKPFTVVSASSTVFVAGVLEGPISGIGKAHVHCTPLAHAHVHVHVCVPNATASLSPLPLRSRKS